MNSPGFSLWLIVSKLLGSWWSSFQFFSNLHQKCLGEMIPTFDLIFSNAVETRTHQEIVCVFPIMRWTHTQLHEVWIKKMKDPVINRVGCCLGCYSNDETLKARPLWGDSIRTNDDQFPPTDLTYEMVVVLVRGSLTPKQWRFEHFSWWIIIKFTEIPYQDTQWSMYDWAVLVDEQMSNGWSFSHIFPIKWRANEQQGEGWAPTRWSWCIYLHLGSFG